MSFVSQNEQMQDPKMILVYRFVEKVVQAQITEVLIKETFDSQYLSREYVRSFREYDASVCTSGSLLGESFTLRITEYLPVVAGSDSRYVISGVLFSPGWEKVTE